MSEQSASIKANRELYAELHRAGGDAAYREATGHLNNRATRELLEGLIARVYAAAAQRTDEVRVLDLGAGEGFATHAFLRLGARVTAVDISEEQLGGLQAQCADYATRLEVRCEDVAAAVERPASFDIVVAISFLHHVPDYLGLIRQIMGRLGPGGQFLSFQDPLRYDTLDKLTYAYSNGSYFAWRLFQGNLLQGLKTRIRRARGIYVAGSKEDDAEYHVTRNGVDQAAICALLEANGFACELHRYFSTQSALLQAIGSGLTVQNYFALVAQRRD